MMPLPERNSLVTTVCQSPPNFVDQDQALTAPRRASIRRARPMSKSFCALMPVNAVSKHAFHAMYTMSWYLDGRSRRLT